MHAVPSMRRFDYVEGLIEVNLDTVEDGVGRGIGAGVASEP